MIDPQTAYWCTLFSSSRVHIILWWNKLFCDPNLCEILCYFLLTLQMMWPLRICFSDWVWIDAPRFVVLSSVWNSFIEEDKGFIEVVNLRPWCHDFFEIPLDLHQAGLAKSGLWIVIFFYRAPTSSSSCSLCPCYYWCLWRLLAQRCESIA